MSSSKTSKILGVVAVVLLIGAVCLRIFTSEPAKPPPSAPGYYTGPMRSKGNPDLAATEDGKSVDLPPLEPAKPETNKPDDSSKKQDAAPALGKTP